MPTAKETILQIIAQQPDDSSYDDILRELVIMKGIQQGLEDSDAGRVVPHEEVLRKFESWRK